MVFKIVAESTELAPAAGRKDIQIEYGRYAMAFKGFIRVVTLGLIVSGWSLAAASIHVIITPGRIMVIPKDRLDFEDTYVDARNWKPDDLRQHPEVVARLIHLGRCDVLAYAVGSKWRSVESQLEYAVEHPLVASSTSPAATDKAKDQLNTASKAMRSVFD